MKGEKCIFSLWFLALCLEAVCGSNKEMSNENLTFTFSACNPITVEITLHGQDEHDQSENCVKLYIKKNARTDATYRCELFHHLIQLLCIRAGVCHVLQKLNAWFVDFV